MSFWIGKTGNLLHSFFFSFTTHTAYWRNESSCVTRRCAANRKKIREIKFGNYACSKFGPRCLLAQRAFLRQYIGAGLPIFDSYLAFLKGSRQWESRGVRNVSFCSNLARTAAIEVRFSLNFAFVFDFIYFRFRPSKAKWLGIVLPNRQNAAIRSMFFFSSFIMRIAYWRRESVRVLRQCAANWKKNPRNKI